MTSKGRVTSPVHILESKNDNRSFTNQFMDMDYRKFDNLIRDLSLLLPYRRSHLPLYHELLLAWVYYRSCAIGDLLCSQSSGDILKE